MQSRLLGDQGQKTYAVIFDTGDEVVSVLTNFARRERLTASHFTGIGAFSAVVLGYFDWTRKDYDRIRLDEQVEVLTMAGDIAVADGQPKVHAHVVVGKRDGSAHGGHLLEARVRPTLEVIVVATPAHLRRVHDADSGIALIDLGADGS
jgi:predicted DNA-binding protein with PD1-like motif